MKQANNLDKKSQRHTFQLLVNARARINNRINDEALEGWDVTHLPRLKRSIDEAINEFKNTYSNQLTFFENDAFDLGMDFVDNLVEIQLETPLALPILSQETLAIWQGYKTDLIVGLTDDMKRWVKTELTLGITGEKSPFELIKTLGKRIPGYKWEKGTFYNKAWRRAEVITRTEISRVLSLSNQARQDQLMTSHPEAMKYWLTTSTGKGARFIHKQIEKQTNPWEGGEPIPLKSKFRLSDGIECSGPHSPELPAKHVIQCRCRAITWFPQEVTKEDYEKLKVRKPKKKIVSKEPKIQEPKLTSKGKQLVDKINKKQVTKKDKQDLFDILSGKKTPQSLGLTDKIKLPPQKELEKEMVEIFEKKYPEVFKGTKPFSQADLAIEYRIEKKLPLVLDMDDPANIIFEKASHKAKLKIDRIRRKVRKQQLIQQEITPKEITLKTPEIQKDVSFKSVKTKEKAQKYLKDNYNIEAKFDGWDIDTINESVKAIDDLNKKYPGVAERIEFFGNINDLPKTMKRDLVENYGLKKWDLIGDDYIYTGNSFATHYEYNGKSYITCNDRWFTRSYNDLLAILKESRKKGWLDAKGEIRDTIIHEYGHALENWFKSLDSSWRMDNKWISFYGKNKATSKLSKYATTTRGEAWAESFAAMNSLDNKVWTPFTKAQEKFIKSLLEWAKKNKKI